MGGGGSSAGANSSSFGSGLINGSASAPSSSAACFIAGTLVNEAGGLKPIEDVCVNDFVWAWNEHTGEAELKRVTKTYVNQTNELLHVFVKDEEIICTPEHPFYSPVKGWTAACKLRAGDILVTLNGEYVVLEKVQHELLESSVIVYNFQVADDHSYYVSSESVLVHNCCAQRINGNHGGAIHTNAINNQMNVLEQSGDYAFLYGNKSWSTAGTVGNERPDIIAIRNDGAVEYWEFASPSQASGRGLYRLEMKMNRMEANNPGVQRHAVYWGEYGRGLQ